MPLFVITHCLWETYIDVPLHVAQVEVVHDGAIVEVLEARHVLHPSDAAVVHGLHLLPGQCILLVGVDLDQKVEKVQSVNCGNNNHRNSYRLHKQSIKLLL